MRGLRCRKRDGYYWWIVTRFQVWYIESQCRKKQTRYGHTGLTPELVEENASITMELPSARKNRPIWDLSCAAATGFTVFGANLSAGKRILLEHDLPDAPMFLIWAVKNA